MQLARTAQVAWAALSVQRRCAYLARLRRDIALRCDALSAVIARDTNKPTLDALAGDVLVTLEQLRAYETPCCDHSSATQNPKASLPFYGTRF